MTAVTVRRRTALAPGAAFARVTTWERHAVPLTTITRTRDGFVARTGVGPLGFDDPMTVTTGEHPQQVRIDKTGRVVLGWAVIDVQPDRDGSVVTWTEDLRVAHLPRVFDPVVRAATTQMLRHVLHRLLPRDDGAWG